MSWIVMRSVANSQSHIPLCFRKWSSKGNKNGLCEFSKSILCKSEGDRWKKDNRASCEIRLPHCIVANALTGLWLPGSSVEARGNYWTKLMTGEKIGRFDCMLIIKPHWYKARFSLKPLASTQKIFDEINDNCYWQDYAIFISRCEV